MQIFILNYSLIAQPLIRLTCKGVLFEFGEEQLDAMKRLKQTLAESPALKVIDYVAEREVVLAVDSSDMGVGYIIDAGGGGRVEVPQQIWVHHLEQAGAELLAGQSGVVRTDEGTSSNQDPHHRS